MYWPNFEVAEIKPNYYKKMPNGTKLALYTMATWHRNYGQVFLKELVQTLPEDLQEGPTREPDEWQKPNKNP